MKNVALLLIAVGCIALSGCSLLGGCETDPALVLQMPVRVAAQTRATELPPQRQTTVFAAPVQPIVEAPMAAQACQVQPPLFGARVQLQK